MLKGMKKKDIFLNLPSSACIHPHFLRQSSFTHIISLTNNGLKLLSSPFNYSNFLSSTFTFIRSNPLLVFISRICFT